MTDDIADYSEDTAYRRERLVIACFLSGLGALGFYDAFEDWIENVSWSHLFFESLLHVIAMAIGAVLFLRIARSRRRSLSKLRVEISETRKLAIGYESLFERYREGVTSAITEQLKRWHLTPAEEEVCLFLLKGFSLQEIADLRKTSERTIRHQASVLYKKTGLGGRAQLSAFFLEDLLVVSPERKQE